MGSPFSFAAARRSLRLRGFFSSAMLLLMRSDVVHLLQISQGQIRFRARAILGRTLLLPRRDKYCQRPCLFRSSQIACTTINTNHTCFLPTSASKFPSSRWRYSAKSLPRTYSYILDTQISRLQSPTTFLASNHSTSSRYTAPARRPISSIMGFGDFVSICEKTPLSLCPLVGPSSSITGAHSVQTNCYARSIELANTIIFQGATGFAHILALIMLVVMIIHVRSKFTAVGMSKRRAHTAKMGN